MTLEDLDTQLPNGLHDARIRSVERDFLHGTVMLAVDILTGLPDDNAAEKREQYKLGKLLFRDVEYLIIEPPDVEAPFTEGGSLWFSVARTGKSAISGQLFARLGKNVLRYSFFIQDWYAYIHVAAQKVEFSWSAHE